MGFQHVRRETRVKVIRTAGRVADDNPYGLAAIEIGRRLRLRGPTESES
jgi:hypothetical protein